MSRLLDDRCVGMLLGLLLFNNCYSGFRVRDAKVWSNPSFFYFLEEF